DLETVGWKEIFFLILAFLTDLGDIIGYSLVPATVASTKTRDPFDVTRLPIRRIGQGPERIPEEYIHFPDIGPVEELEASENTPTTTQKQTTLPESDPSNDPHALSFKRRGTSQFRL
ncbi:MAG: hypothetical protein L3K26_11750, partial [Candidatus Hydrogenedentes bacterium]|nr:hypothetical protein [Candidatus Hydrogenedentota bacterium]